MTSPYEADPSQFTVQETATLREVAENLNVTRLRLAFVLDQARVVGTVSDGDLRRAWLRGHDGDTPVGEIMTRDFVFARQVTEPTALESMFRQGIDAIPLLDDNDSLLAVLRDSSRRSFIPVSAPDITSYERELANQALNSGWISSAGRFVREFEEEFASFTGGGAAVAVNNGTSALALALWSLGIGPGDEVIVPDLTFGATANAVIQVGARPVLSDVLRSSWSVGADSLDAVLTSSTRAVIPVHLYGLPAPMKDIWDFAKSRGIVVIEDCAEAIGTYYASDHVGTQSHAGTFSFYGNKTISTGEGGMVLFRSDVVANRARKIRAQGMSAERRYWHTTWGTNLRLTSLQSAIGLGQLRRIDTILERKYSLARKYDQLMGPLFSKGLAQAAPVHEPRSTCQWLYTILLSGHLDNSAISERLLASGVETRYVFAPLHEQPAFAEFASVGCDYAASKEISKRGLSLPSSPNLTFAEQEYVVECLRNVLEDS